MSIRCLDIWTFTYEGLGVYPIWEKYMFFLPTLDGSALILRPKSSINFLHLVLFTINMGSKFPLFSTTGSAVSKIDPTVVGSSRKRFEMLPWLSPIIFYRHIVPLSRLQKNSESALRTSWYPGYGEFFLFCGPLSTWPTQVSDILVVVRGPQTYKNWTSNGRENWGRCIKKWQEHSFVNDNANESVAENWSDRLYE